MKAHFPKHKKQIVKPGHQSPTPVQKQMASPQSVPTPKSAADILYPPTNPPANVMGQ